MENSVREFYLADLVGILWKRKVLIVMGTFLVTLLTAVIVWLGPKSYMIKGKFNLIDFRVNDYRLEKYIEKNFYYYNMIIKNKFVNLENYHALMSFPRSKNDLKHFCQDNETFKEINLDSIFFSYHPDINADDINKSESEIKVNSIEMIVRSKKKNNLNKYYTLIGTFTERRFFETLMGKINENLKSSLRGKIIDNESDIKENKAKLQELYNRSKTVIKYKNYPYINSQIAYSDKLMDFLPAPLQLQNIDLKVQGIEKKNIELKDMNTDIIFLLGVLGENKTGKITSAELIKKRFKTYETAIFWSKYIYYNNRIKESIKFNKSDIQVKTLSKTFLPIAFIVSFFFFVFVAFLLEWISHNKNKILRK